MFLMCIGKYEKRCQMYVCVCARACASGALNDTEELHRSLDVPFIMVISYNVVCPFDKCACVCWEMRGLWPLVCQST